MDVKPVRVAAISSGKGGVGKTSFSINLAEALSRAGNRVLLMDADFNLANVHLMLGQTPDKTIADVMSGRCSISDTLLPGPASVRVVPGVRGRGLADIGCNSLLSLIQSVDELVGEIDILLLDTAGGFQERDMRLMAAASDVMVMLTPDKVTIADTAEYIRTLRQQYGVQHFNIVTNMVRGQRESSQLMQALQSQVGFDYDLILRHVGTLPYDTAVRKASDSARTWLQTDPDSKVCRGIQAIADAMNQQMRAYYPRGGMTFFFESHILAGGC
ncbi:MAG: P-loop NTPase [Endozoicomonadaceae bacterium]|nr:P-loop NTPase [Endozoicomonadaceae bacterium]